MCLAKPQSIGFALLLLFADFGVCAQNMEVFTAQHRPAEELVTVLRPLLAPGESISAYQGQIIVSAESATLNRIRQILQQIDQAARQFIVQWKITAERAASKNVMQGTVTVQSDGQQISGTVGANVVRSQDARRSEFSQQVRVQEGASAWIALSTQIPLIVRQTLVGPYGLVNNSANQYVSFTSGLAVTPRRIGSASAGAQIQLELAPQYSSPAYTNRASGALAAAPVHNTIQARTLLTANLGEWIEIGSIGDITASDTRGTLSSSEARQQGLQYLLLRVDEIRGNQ